jgi:hypothetical protein
LSFLLFGKTSCSTMHILWRNLPGSAFVPVLASLFISVMVSRPTTLYAQHTWYPAQPIPNYEDIYPPYLVAAQNGTVHAFYTQTVNAETGRVAVYYRQWSLHRGWTKPIDVILAPRGGTLRIGDAYLDPSGTFHLVYTVSRVSDIGILYHASADASEVDQAHGWSSSTILDELAGPLFFANLSGDDEGNLVLVYTGQKLGIGVYEVHSIPGGDTWSDPSALALVAEEDRLPAHIRVTVDADSRFHAVWSVMEASRGIGVGVYYARVVADGAGWSSPTLLADRTGTEYGTDWPSVAAHDGALFVVYMDGGPPPTRWLRRSTDGGETWSIPHRPFPQEGENGHAVLLKDSSNTLHIVLSNRVGDPPVGGTWHGVWLGTKWSDLQLITPRSEAEAKATGSYGYSQVGNSSRPNAVISQGNVLLVTWWHDMRDAPPAGYSYTVLDAPQISPSPVPGAAAVEDTPSVTPLPTSLPAPTVVPARAVNIPSNTSLPVDLDSPGLPVVIGLGSAALLIAAVVIVVLWRLSTSSR